VPVAASARSLCANPYSITEPAVGAAGFGLRNSIGLRGPERFCRRRGSNDGYGNTASSRPAPARACTSSPSSRLRALGARPCPRARAAPVSRAEPQAHAAASEDFLASRVRHGAALVEPSTRPGPCCGPTTPAPTPLASIVGLADGRPSNPGYCRVGVLCEEQLAAPWLHVLQDRIAASSASFGSAEIVRPGGAGAALARDQGRVHGGWRAGAQPRGGARGDLPARHRRRHRPQAACDFPTVGDRRAFARLRSAASSLALALSLTALRVLARAPLPAAPAIATPTSWWPSSTPILATLHECM